MAKKPTVPIPITLLAVLRLVLREGEAVCAIPGSSRHFISSLGYHLEVTAKTVIRRSGHIQSSGYLQAWIKLDDGSKDRRLMHCIVMEEFEGPRPVDEFGEPYQVHHIDGDILNNALSNLKCLTAAEHRRLTRISNQGPAKLKVVDIWIARCKMPEFGLATVAVYLAEQSKVGDAAARAAITGKTWNDIPFPSDPISVADLAHALGVNVVRAAELLDLARPSSGRRAA